MSKKPISFATWFWLAMAVGIGGSLYYLYGPEGQQRKLAKKRAEDAESERLLQGVRNTVAKGPVIARHQTSYGEVLHMRIPRPAAMGYMVEYLDCVVWRDDRYAKASISCPPEVDPHEIGLSEEKPPDEKNPGAPPRFQ